MNFKLKFHTSATSLLEPYEIKARIQLELNDWKYNIKYVTDKSVSFKDNPWRFRWNLSPKMVDAGEFTIGDNDGIERLLSLNYDYNYLPPLLIFAALTIILISQGEYAGILFFAVFYGVTVPIDIMRSRGAASELVAAILQADT